MWWISNEKKNMYLSGSSVSMRVMLVLTIMFVGGHLLQQTMKLLRCSRDCLSWQKGLCWGSSIICENIRWKLSQYSPYWSKNGIVCFLLLCWFANILLFEIYCLWTRNTNDIIRRFHHYGSSRKKIQDSINTGDLTWCFL